MHIDNEKKRHLNTWYRSNTRIRWYQVQRLKSSEAQYLINFSRSNRTFCLSLDFNGSNSFLFVSATKIYQFKAKDSEMKIYSLCLRNFSGEVSSNHMKKNRIKWVCYDVSVDYRAFDSSNIINSHKYLMKKHGKKITFGIVKKNVYWIIN